jgi:hypothetical protein
MRLGFLPGLLEKAGRLVGILPFLDGSLELQGLPALKEGVQRGGLPHDARLPLSKETAQPPSGGWAIDS